MPTRGPRRRMVEIQLSVILWCIFPGRSFHSPGIIFCWNGDSPYTTALIFTGIFAISRSLNWFDLPFGPKSISSIKKRYQISLSFSLCLIARLLLPLVLHIWRADWVGYSLGLMGFVSWPSLSLFGSHSSTKFWRCYKINSNSKALFWTLS